MNKMIAVLVLGLCLTVSGFAGMANLQLNTEGEYQQIVEEIPQEFEIVGVIDLDKYQEMYLCQGSVGSSQCALWDVNKDADLLLNVTQLDETACDFEMFVDATTIDLTGVGVVDFNNVSSGQDFGIRFTSNDTDDQNCSIAWDLTAISYVVVP